MKDMRHAPVPFHALALQLSLDFKPSYHLIGLEKT